MDRSSTSDCFQIAASHQRENTAIKKLAGKSMTFAQTIEESDNNAIVRCGSFTVKFALNGLHTLHTLNI